jgi:proline racemase
VVISGLPVIEGTSMAEKRLEIIRKHDSIRRVLLQEPRGYPCQNADLIFPSALPEVAFGFVILEQNAIYPMMSGV